MAYKRAGKHHDAARSFEAAGDLLRAAQSHTAAGEEGDAIRILVKGAGPKDCFLIIGQGVAVKLCKKHENMVSAWEAVIIPIDD